MMHHPVLSAITRRREQGSVPGQRKDDLKIALAVEGGAMRGVVSAGMVAGLEYLGLLPAFDVIYGTSAGAINGAYFVVGQGAYGTSIYYDEINNSQFINPLRWLYGDPSISLDLLFEHVMIRRKPLVWQRVVDSSIELVPVATPILICSTANSGFGPRRGEHVQIGTASGLPRPAAYFFQTYRVEPAREGISLHHQSSLTGGTGND